jgi:2-methylisocitrate lyase-like PEP mutase family enzyme
MKDLVTRLKEPGLITVPGIFDLVSAKIAETYGFDALYMTGFGVVASHLGLPDAGLASYADMVDRLRRMVETVATPIIADGDTGYGGLLNVDFSVRGYEKAGAAAIQIEDQEFPKKCGHTPQRRVVPLEDAARRIRVAREARSSSKFLIVARTDARTAHGLDEALRRGEAFLKAGADILFIESPESAEEMRKIARAFHCPLVANMVEGGRTPILSRHELTELGFKIALFPTSGLLAMAQALNSVYEELRHSGSSKDWSGRFYPFDGFTRLMGFERIWEFEKAHVEV